MPTPIKPTLLRRLPPNYRPAPSRTLPSRPNREEHSVIGSDSERLYQRHQGGLLSRALGTAVHSLLESLALLRKTSTGKHPAPPSSNSNPASPPKSAPPASPPPASATSPPKLSVSPSPPPTTPPATGFSPPILKKPPKPAGPASSPATSAPSRSTASFAPASPRSPPATKPGGSSTTKPPTPTHRTQPQPCLSCAQPSPRSWKPTPQSSANCTAQTHLSAPASTIRACFSSIGGKFRAVSKRR